jgi:hypothetical protein
MRIVAVLLCLLVAGCGVTVIDLRNIRDEPSVMRR